MTLDDNNCLSLEVGGTLQDSIELLLPLMKQTDHSFAVSMLSHALSATAPLKDISDYEIKAIAIAIGAFNPKDAVEGMLAAQIVSLHFQLERVMSKGASSTFPDATEGYLNLATKLMKAFSFQLEALRKYRQKGQQKMVVEHVNINAGGQAVIGHVTAEGGV